MTRPNPEHLRIHPAQRAELLARVGPIVDAHFHQWDLAANHYPWLQESPVKAHFGDYAAIRQSYLPADFAADHGEVVVAKRVHIEAHWRGFVDPAGETRWLSALAGGPDAIVGHADLLAENLADVLDAHMQSSEFRGVRMMTQRPQPPAGLELISDPRFLAGLKTLAARGLNFDLQARPDMLQAARNMAENVGDLPIALTHAGLPLDRSSEGIELWQEGLRDIAKAPNVICKLSGLAMGDWHWSVASMTEMVRRVFDIFGPERLCFGSNFPVDRLFARYPDLLAAHIAALQSEKDADLRAVFHETAHRFYRL
ncbi:amidohydrolase family protein [Cognatishimia sp. SS12]|uniref:amidohydrolase family protein n=1 Tax=Cognatishimia sp. SS12 TaxID=2979465 RepID=UPI00232E5FB0|nr:amidohydrolase family protein [Cognatishimia sp. SS12]MDC0739583.1 amidohydrolase family protein [Cognatishimia sp. SS12]